MTKPSSAAAALPAAPLSYEHFQLIETKLAQIGYGYLIAWSETLQPPRSSRVFAQHVIFVICNSGMNAQVAQGIYDRCIRTLRDGRKATSVYGHPTKSKAVDYVWRKRRKLFTGFKQASDKLGYCETLPFIGPVTKHHLAKNLGVNTVKPDIHLARLAAGEGSSAWDMCARLAQQSGYREATVDTLLWRACAEGLLDSRAYLEGGLGQRLAGLGDRRKPSSFMDFTWPAVSNSSWRRRSWPSAARLDLALR